VKTIAISFQKDGAGKITLAAELVGYGQTILIDADPQGNTSAWVGPDSLSVELAGVLFERSPLNNQYRNHFAKYAGRKQHGCCFYIPEPVIIIKIKNNRTIILV